MDDSDRMDTSSPAAAAKQSSSPSSSDGSDSDSDADILAHTQTQAAQLARIRSAAAQKKEPRLPPISGSVFGGRDASESAAAKQMENDLRSMMLQRRHKAEAREAVASIRRDLEAEIEADSAGDNLAATLAASEQRAEAARLRLHDKYHCPIVLFAAPVCFPLQNDVHWTQPTRSLHPLHDLLLASASGPSTTSMVVFSRLVNSLCRQRLYPPDFVADMLFFRTVYNPNPEKPGAFLREEEANSLRTIIEHRTEDLKLPSMLEVLRSYGGRFEESCARADAIANAPAGSLDKRVIEGKGDLPVGLDVCCRNLSCAFDVWVAQVASEMCLRSLLGETQPLEKGLSETAVYCRAIIVLSARVLLSPFGARLKIAVGRLIKAVLNRVDDSEWDTFRQQAAQEVIGITTRFGLHCELLTHLFPGVSKRARHLGLDVSFLSLTMWHAGPADNPQPADVADFWQNTMKEDEDGERVSFVVQNVLDCMLAMPEFGKQTDVDWAFCMAKVLKQVIVDRDVLGTRKDGEVARLQGLIKKMKLCSHRLAFGVPRQRLALTLDALLFSLRGFLDKSKSVKQELNPNIKDEPIQANIVSMFGKKKQPFDHH